MQHPEHTARTEQLKRHLRDQGYGSSACRSYVRIASRFLEYLYGHARTVETATPADVESFLRRERRLYRNRHGHAPPSIPEWRRARTAPLRLILKLVQGKWPPEPASKKETPRELFHRKLLKGYDIWMDELRGLARVTRVQRIERAHEFLCGIGKRSDPDRLHELQVRDIDAYLSCRTEGLRRKSIKDLTSELRVFLQYLHENGETTRDLSMSVTSPILYTYEDIPSALLTEEVEKVLATARRDRTVGGRRDYAILMLLATYGLRAGEITALRLDDLDWKNEVLLVRHSKNRTSSKLPLLPGPGEALLDYLKNARPRSAIREVFLCLNAPHRAIPAARASALYAIIRRRLDAAGIVRHGKKGPHAFRHARAVSLLRAAVPLKEIGDILGHRSPASTGVYLKLATEDLRGVALEVPGEGSR
jgi:integrase/recombinase XerD